jgi:hypothetical protein
MNKSVYKVLAVLFGIMSFGAISESYRIMTSNAYDVASKRSSLPTMGIVMTILFLSLTWYFWRKGKSKK